MSYRALRKNDRVLLVCSVEEISNDLLSEIPRPVTVMLPAWKPKDQAWSGQLEAAVRILLDIGVESFACVGSEAEFVHDELDLLVEEREQNTVVTTFHDDEPLEDACVYFVGCAGQRPPGLIAVVSENTTASECLIKVFEEAV